MGKEEPFCTIDVPNVETAAYLMALISPDIKHLCSSGPKYFVREVVRTFQGGVSGLQSAAPKIRQQRIWHQLRSVILRTGAYYTETSASWLEPKAPAKIDGNSVTCRKSGVK